MHKISLEFWADSFHEGFWACQELDRFFKLKEIIYEKGFIPVFLFQVNQELELEITVFGSYKNWDPLPEPIAYLIEWGKPDLIAYDPAQKKILVCNGRNRRGSNRKPSSPKMRKNVWQFTIYKSHSGIFLENSVRTSMAGSGETQSGQPF